VDYRWLARAVAQDAALRRKQVLQPVGGKGDKIFPPTYPGERPNSPPRHILESRRIEGSEVQCAVLDSVQSQANRLEEALLAAIREGAVSVPYVTVDFRGTVLPDIGEVTSLDAPHRVYDAILRDSWLKGTKTPFLNGPDGERLKAALPSNATALLEISPSALLFGSWYSTGQGGGLGARFSRSLVSEIIAVNIQSGRRGGVRVDPLGILSSVKVVGGPTDWRPAGEKEKGAKRPSELNHSNVIAGAGKQSERLAVWEQGITCDCAEHTAVLSFAGLRRLGFGSAERDAAGRSLLAALGLVALTEQDTRGYALRSRCDLVCDGRAPFELVHADGSIDRLEIGREAARAAYRAAHKDAITADFKLLSEPIRLTPQDKLVAIVKRSRELALEGKGGEVEEAQGS
jgi:CRISPR-associated protein Csb1